MKRALNRANIMYIPAILLILFFVIFPFLRGFSISTTNWNGFSQSYKSVGLQNFTDMLVDPVVRGALVNTLIYGFVSTFFQQIIAIGYAVFLNAKFPGRIFARTCIYLPVLVPGLVMGYMWFFLTKYDGGALNDVLSFFGKAPIFWLGTKATAICVILAINTIQFVGISMLIYLSGLQAIPDMYYEAAKIDGAGSWQIFRHITLPLLYPALTTSVTLNLIGGLKLFDSIVALTNGGPNYATHSLSTLINETYFQGQNAGYASAIGILLFVLIVCITLALQAVFKKHQVDV
ncbi:carbohydrate ABC transporter permease [Bifidobacterium aquikefiri]|uniref:carbohydrate ABC transporter permease n=1 Tax=Bifidobacterium aquikefiri TaxID=1653207 RepID=UPI0039ED137A